MQSSIPFAVRIATAVVVLIVLISILGLYSDLTVSTVDTNKNYLSGYRIVLYENGKVVGKLDSGSISDTFTLGTGHRYFLRVGDSGLCRFDHWQDTGATNRSRQVSIVWNTQLTAVYACSSTPATSQLIVASKDGDGAAVGGLIVRLSSGGSTIDTGISPYTFHLINGNAYIVQVYDSASCRFEHWQDLNSTSASRMVSITSDTRLTTIYTCHPQ